MTTLNSALNYQFAYAESAKIAYAERGADEAIAAQIRQAAANAPYQVGSTITARYQYKVGPDGSLVPQQTQITHTAPEDDATFTGGRRQRANREDERRATLGDLARPKPELSPSDELSLFAAAEAPHTVPVDVTDSAVPLSPIVQAKAEVLDENGESVEAELLTGNATQEQAQPNKSPLLSLLAARAQTAAANLYARNNDIVYSTTPLAAFAA